jgi:hypothetical protein
VRSIVTTEIIGLGLRHRLLDRLAGRLDILNPEKLPPALAKRIPHHIVAGLDDDREPGTGGWPVPTGGRYAKLCFSQVLDSASANEDGALYPLPLTCEDYVSYVARITGIGAEQHQDFARLYRFDPAELFDHSRVMRAESPAAWRLLLSNEFALARKAWPALNDPPPGFPYRYPLIQAFMVVSEFERASLIMRHLARARDIVIDRVRFLEALQSPLPLSLWFKPHELVEVCRWIEYASLSNAAMRDLIFDRTDREVYALPRGYAPWAFARGGINGGAAGFHDHPEVRKAMAAIFAKPPLPAAPGQPAPVERRTGLLRDAQIIRWYGMTGEVIPILALDGAREAYPTRRVKMAHSNAAKTESSRPVLAALAAAIRNRADPAMQRTLDAAVETYLKDVKSAGQPGKTFEANTKLGLKMALTYLPRRGRPGAAARFNPLIWDDPLRDAGFWRMLLNPRRGGQLHRLCHPKARQLRVATGLLRRVYGPLFARVIWSADIARIACDLAAAIGPISSDPGISFAIHALEQKPNLKKRLGFAKHRPGYGRK